MKQISLENVKRWITVSNDHLSHPVSIHTICPSCSLNVVFATRRRSYDALRDTLACSAECPSCNVEAHFWMTNMMAMSEISEEIMPELFMMPASEPRTNLEEVGGLLPDNVLQYCKSTQDVFQSGNLTATRVMVKSTLDAIFSSFLPAGNSRTTLSRMVQDSLPTMDVSLPMTSLANSLRKGEHLDRLLNSSQPASHDSAHALMSLVEKLVEFLYVIPAQFEELNQQLVELSQDLPVEDQNTEAESGPEAEINARTAEAR